MANRRTWTDEELVESVARNTTRAGVLRDLGLTPSGGNYRALNERVRVRGIDTSHWLGQAHFKGRQIPHLMKKTPLEEILVAGSTYNRGLLKKRLIRGGHLPPVCAACGMAPVWQGRALVLHLDHINGDSLDNRLENLRLLCPNCHSQQPTQSRGMRVLTTPTGICAGCGCESRRLDRKGFCPNCIPREVPPTCRSCGKETVGGGKECRSCGASRAQRTRGFSGRKEKAAWPTNSELVKEVSRTSFSAVGRRLGVSDNAVRKRLKVRGLLHLTTK